ncbi:MAG TPA: NAD(P)/FAD-dependent oxidoreductase, partial [Anaerolineales bacterium]|nr:NAD(P)/FAD-dependent oxidoreductase [Anaerolineales bacterium]
MPEQHPRHSAYDAVIVGAGPNGLAAGIVLARAGLRVIILEGTSAPGGGTRSAELTLPGFIHDPCAAVHPFGKASPFFRSLPLDEYGLKWIQSDAPLVHPLDGGKVVVVERDIDATAAGLGSDGPAYRRWVKFWVEHWEELFADLVGPLPLPPKHPFTIARVAPQSLLPAETVARAFFQDAGTQVLFAGMAGHSMLPLNRPLTGAFGWMLSMLSHVIGWPIVQGGTQGLANALVAYYRSLGGELVTDCWVKSMADLPPARAVLFDTPPRSVLNIAGDILPAAYRRQLGRFRYGQGVFKIDYALDAPIPWENPG